MKVYILSEAYSACISGVFTSLEKALEAYRKSPGAEFIQVVELDQLVDSAEEVQEPLPSKNRPSITQGGCMKFKFNDRVRIDRPDFYEGMTGLVREVRAGANGHAEYVVLLDGYDERTPFIPGHYLEAT